jgi:hypothetical protein
MTRRMTGRLADDAALTVDDVASISRRERHEVLTAIGNRRLIARQERGEWVVRASEMRRWLARA